MHSRDYQCFPGIFHAFPGFSMLYRDFPCFPRISYAFPGLPMLSLDSPCLPGISYAFPGYPMPSRDFPCFPGIHQVFVGIITVPLWDIIRCLLLLLLQCARKAEGERNLALYLNFSKSFRQPLKRRPLTLEL